jgi:Domain of unknown function (DUF4249)
MKNIIQFTTIIVLFLACTGCNKDFFKVKVPVTLPDYESKPVIIADIDPSADQFKVFLTKSRRLDNSTPYNTVLIDSIFDINGNFVSLKTPINMDTIANARLMIVSPSGKSSPLKYNNGYYYGENIQFEHGSNYKIQLENSAFTDVYGSATFPLAVPIDTLIYKPSSVYKPGIDIKDLNDKIDELSVYFKDPPNETNIYQILITGYDSLNVAQRVRLEYLDNFSDKQTLTDRSFNGKSYVWRFGIDPNRKERNNPNPIRIVSYVVVLKSISNDKYKYELSRDLYNKSKDNPFAEPTILYSNINNGIGIFSITSRSTKVLTK